MKFRRARLALPLVMLLPALAACNGDDKPAASAGMTVSPTTPSPTPTRVYTKRLLKKGLLPLEQLPGYKKFPLFMDGEKENIDATDLVPITGIPKKCRASDGGPGLLDTSRVTPEVENAPSASIAYERKLNMFVEELIGLPSATTQGFAKLRIPPGCERQSGEMEGQDAYVKVRALDAGDLPALGNVEISGLQVNFYLASIPVFSARLIQVRSGQLLMQVTSEAPEGEIEEATNTPLKKAWIYARQRLG